MRRCSQLFKLLVACSILASDSFPVCNSCVSFCEWTGCLGWDKEINTSPSELPGPKLAPGEGVLQVNLCAWCTRGCACYSLLQLWSFFFNLRWEIQVLELEVPWFTKEVLAVTNIPWTEFVWGRRMFLCCVRLSYKQLQNDYFQIQCVPNCRLNKTTLVGCISTQMALDVCYHRSAVFGHRVALQTQQSNRGRAYICKQVARI